MKKISIILLITAVIISALCIWQRNNIKAVYIFLTTDSESVEKLLEENKKALDDKIKTYSEYAPRNLTVEEEKKIASGELSMEEAAKLLLEGTEEEKGAESEATAPEIETEVKNEVEAEKPADKNVTEKNNTAEQIAENKKKEGEIIRNYTAQFYSMKAYYIGQLSQIEAQAKKDYSAMSAEEKNNLSKTAFVNKYMGYATALQSECDTKVNSLLKSMKTELKAVNGDISIIDVIQQAYSDEKAARKAYYMNMVS